MGPALIPKSGVGPGGPVGPIGILGQIIGCVQYGILRCLQCLGQLDILYYHKIFVRNLNIKYNIYY